MKKILILLIGVQIVGVGLLHAGPFEDAIEKSLPAIKVALVDSEYEVNGKSMIDRAAAIASVEAAIERFGNDLPLALVVEPETRAEDVLMWYEIASRLNIASLRVFVASAKERRDGEFGVMGWDDSFEIMIE